MIWLHTTFLILDADCVVVPRHLFGVVILVRHVVDLAVAVVRCFLVIVS